MAHSGAASVVNGLTVEKEDKVKTGANTILNPPQIKMRLLHTVYYKHLLLTNRDYTVGRVNVDFVMLDPSVSRLHAKLRISYPEEAVDAGSHMAPVLEITDVSRFGTFLNGSRIIRNVATSVPTDSKITFGATPGVTINAEVYPLNVLLSSVSPLAKTKVRATVHSLGGKVFYEWAEECTLLVMSKLVVTHKLQRFRLLLGLTNAKLVCIAEALSASRQCFVDIFGSISDPCVLYEAGNAVAEHDLAYSVLKETFNRRPILEQEIALAIIECSCETYCNTTCPCPISNTRQSIGGNAKVAEVKASNVKCSCGQAPLMLPSTLFDKLGKRSTEIPRASVPGTWASSTQIVEKRSPRLGKGKDSGVIVSHSVFKSDPTNSREPVIEGGLEGAVTSSIDLCIVIKDDSMLDAFASMPPLSSILKGKKTLPSYHASSRNPSDEHDVTRKSCVNSSPNSVLASKLGNLGASRDIATEEKENLAPDTCNPSRSSPINEFVSKGKNKTVTIEDEDGKNDSFANVDNIKVRAEVCTLVTDAALPGEPSRSESKPATAGFKRFTKVIWSRVFFLLRW
ncbi:unnamed protein product [Hydatigera taeniaeformis]|uniref:FHA domain-containing protein n=1 Tax=Hydatigena taeniaeformis TaxID=6205 RepID=A0A0R3X6B0_HYDTA|nr:unnamed protein product [Hydatigera taeniaeformis]